MILINKTDTIPSSMPCKSLARKNIFLFSGKPLHTEKIWKWTHKPPNPIVNPDKKAQRYVFENDTLWNDPLQNSINIYSNEEMVSLTEEGNRETITVIKTENVAIKAIIKIIFWELVLTASLNDFM